MTLHKSVLLFVFIVGINSLFAQQVKVLFEASKAQTAGNADWVIDEDLNNMTWNPNATIGSGNEGNAQRFPTPTQSNITVSTLETYWKGALSSWGIDCVKRGYSVETLPYNGSITYGNTSNAQDLSNYSIYVVDEPNILYTAAEKTAIIQFVKNGGGLFLISDHITSDRNNDGEDSPEILNDLLMNNSIQSNPFGFLFDSANVSPLSSNIPNLPNDSLLHGPMGNVTQVMWANGTTISLFPAINPSVKGIVYNTGASFGNKSVLVCYARYGKGKVVAMGDSSPADDGTGDSGDGLYNGWTTDAAGNHERLIMNGTIWLATKDSFIAPPTFTDLALDSIKNPLFIRGAQSLMVKIRNAGTNPIDTITISFQLDNNVIQSFTSSINLNPGDTITWIKLNGLNISTPGTHQLKVWVNAKNDSIHTNDTLVTNLSIPYLKHATIKTLASPVLLQKGNNTVAINLINDGEVNLTKATLSFKFGNDTSWNRETKTYANFSVDSTVLFTFNQTALVAQSGNYLLTIKLLQLNTQADSILFNDSVLNNFQFTSSGMPESSPGVHFSVFPNPIPNHEMNIQSTEEGIFTLTDIQGRIWMKEIRFKQKQTKFSMDDIPAGIYFLLWSTEHETGRTKIVFNQ